MTKRRGHGEGCIYQRADGRWAAVLDLGWQNGKRNRKFMYGRTRREVSDRLNQALTAQREGRSFVNERTTVASFVDAWLEGAKGTVRPSTWQRYEQYARKHVVPHIGKVRLARLQPIHIQRLYADRLSSGLSPTSVLHLHRFLHRIFDQAVRWNAAPRNVTDLVDPPRARRHAFRTLNPEEAKRLIEGVRDDRLGALVAVAMMTGMREGELLALRWRDVDLKRGTVQVRGSRQHDGTIRETKTAGSRRLVLLPRVACEALGRHRASQASERLRLGPEWEDNDLVFANKVGRTLSAQNLLQRYFYPTLERLELPRIRFHDLRHTAATLLLAEGVHPKIVSEMLGHTEVGITLDLYSHVTPTMQAEAVRALDAVFGSQNGSQDHDPERKIPGQPS